MRKPDIGSRSGDSLLRRHDQTDIETVILVRHPSMKMDHGMKAFPKTSIACTRVCIDDTFLFPTGVNNDL